MSKIKLRLLFGGKSGEHEVSKQTAVSVMKAIDQNKYDVFPVYIGKDGKWHSLPRLAGEPEQILQLTKDVSKNRKKQDDSSPLPALFAEHGNSVSNGTGGSGDEPDIEVVFPLLHGPNGEDGTVQGLLELADLPYVGAGVATSAVGMDKVMMKKVFAYHGLPQVDFVHYTRKLWRESPEEILDEVEHKIGFPCFVKPVNLGSSVGISKSRNRDELQVAISLALEFDKKVIVEAFADAREIEVSVLGNDDPIVSVAGEIVPKSEFYDYRAKYHDENTSLIIPADIDKQTYATMKEMALQAYRAIDGSGLSRVDFFVTRGDGRVLINEINTMPGFTPVSMYPLLWQHSGISYQELIDRLIELALERHREKQQNRVTMDE